VLPIDRNIVMRASEIVQGSAGLSARDAVHLAVMERHRITRIMSFDSDFDRWPGITRL
jgi:predicted nucleic acid-binding protein